MNLNTASLAKSIRRAAFLPLLACVPVAKGQDFDKDIKPDGTLKMEPTIRGRYLEGLGFVLLGNPRGVAAPFAPTKKGTEGLSGTPKNELFFSDTDGWAPRLTFPGSGDVNVNERDVVLLMRLQDSLTTSGKDAGPAFWNFVSDNSSGSESFEYSGALVFDLYLPGINGFAGYNKEGYGFHFDFGADFDRSNADGKDSVDRQEYFVGINILAPKISKLSEGIVPSKASEMDFAFRYQRDDVTGEDSTSVAVQWKPVFKKILGREISYESILENGFADLFTDPKPQPVPAAVSSAATEGGAVAKTKTNLEVEKLTDKNDPSSAKRDYFSIQPNIDVEQILKHASGYEDGICGVGGLEVSASAWEQRFILKYQINAAYNFDASDSFCFQEASLSFKPWTDGPLSMTASYQKGERAPTYRDEDVFRLGIGAKF